MQNYLKDDVVLARYPFTNLLNAKVRPAVVVSEQHISEDVFIVPLTSKVVSLLPGEFVLSGWADAGLNVPTAVKRGIYTTNKRLIIKKIGILAISDAQKLENSLMNWLGLL
jgi:mRNA interferase MazF